MSPTVRQIAIESITNRVPSELDFSEGNICDIYGEDVFNLKVMKDFLPKPVYKSLVNTIQNGQTIDPAIADDVANAMKRWAIQKGASHYTHWFQPLTGTTAEKHDSFIESDVDGGVILNFSGKSLIQGEPDASSFPSGGLRATFEARGYTAWDPTSPAFIKRTENGATLCIPTAFCSYTGEALDKKTPLLRSLQILSTHATRVLSCFRNDLPGNVVAELGIEQEYFLVAKELYSLRPDLVMTGRTLFGCIPPKHQQMEDHYFGSIKTRVLEFMTDVDQSLWRLGIPAKTRHNEVAPAQFEIAPIYEGLNLAVDHNMLTMEVLRKVADRHGFVCLLHEKPFAGVNGSGKHNNWSLSMKGMGSLFTPGNSPHENAIFLTFMCAVLQAVDRHADILRASVATAGNEHRLGANEAPPAVISIYLGEALTDVIDQLEKGSAKSSKKGTVLSVGVDSLPVLPKDTSDRNRTSPFAFTGNKFEFRAVGSAQNCGWPMTILNTIMAESLDEIATILEPAVGKKNFNETLQKLLQSIVKQHRKIIFNGDGYNDAWLKEAQKRKLPNLKTTQEALAILLGPKTESLFGKYGVLKTSELHARYEVLMEAYQKQVQIEAKTSLLIAKNQILPVVTQHVSQLAKTVKLLKEAGIRNGLKSTTERTEFSAQLLDQLVEQIDNLEKLIDSNHTESIKKSGLELRETVDLLESMVDDAVWPLPKFREMFFSY